MSEDNPSMTPPGAPSKPLMVFDGDCGFCRRWIVRWQRATAGAVDYLPFQDPTVATAHPNIPAGDFARTVHLILPDGTVFTGAAAVFRSLYEGGRDRWWWRFYQRSDGFAELTELLYEEVASHREGLSMLDRIFSGPGLMPPSHLWMRWIFLRGLALVYLVAFISLASQITGLSGHDGIAPAHQIMQSARAGYDQANLGASRYLLTPTLAWWNDSDAFLKGQCYAGIALSVVLLLGIAPAPALFLLWCLYLSLATVCVPFLDFPWDNLLLETGFLAILFAPLQWIERPSRQAGPTAVSLWLLRWLLFRLMFESGAVKLMSGDSAWWQLSALRVHYETQPLPTWLGWHAHQLPVKAQTFCAAVMFFIELVGPPLIFAGRRFRALAAGLFALLMVLILLTGNYTYFNWLTLLLCLTLLDDGLLPWVRRPAEPPPAEWAGLNRTRWPRRVTIPAAVVIVCLTLIGFFGVLRQREAWPRPVIALYEWLAPWRSFNAYGLFAVMTQSRREIIVEGSNDGKTWAAYEFKYKPGALDREPAFVAPMQPRLDWQMWFAALTDVRHNPWFLQFEVRLLQGSPEVLALLQRNPFPNAPPKYIRASLYRYHFTDAETRRQTGQWWRREYLGVYLPPIGEREKPAKTKS